MTEHQVCNTRELWSRQCPIVFGTQQFDGKEVAGEMLYKEGRVSNTLAGVISWSQEQWNTKDEGLDSYSQDKSICWGKDHSSFLPVCCGPETTGSLLFLFWMGGFVEVFLCSTVMCYERGLHMRFSTKRNLTRLLQHPPMWLKSCLGRTFFLLGQR